MSKYSNRRVTIEIGKEPSRGTGPGSTTVKYIVAKASVSFRDIITKIKQEASVGLMGASRGELAEDCYAQGSIEIEMRTRSLGLLLLNWFGTDTPALVSGTMYNHVYTESESNQKQSLYIKVYDPDKALLYRNVMISKIDINSVMGDVVKLSIDVVGKKGIPTVNTQISKVTEYNFTKNHTFVRVAADTNSLDAASRLSLKSLKLTLDRGNIDMDQSHGTAEPEDFLNSEAVRYTGELVMNYEDETWKDYVFDNTVRAMRVEFRNNDVTIDSNNPRFYIDFVNVQFDDMEPEDGESTRRQVIRFQAHVVETTGLHFDDCKLLTDVAAY